MQVGIGVGHHLVGFFGRRIQADRRVGGIGLGEPFPVAVAIDRAGGGEHKMRGRLSSTRINQVLEAHNIAPNVGARVLQRVTNPRLREVNHVVKVVLGKE